MPDAGKGIWCEICAIEEPPATSLSVDDLLALSADDEPDEDGVTGLPRQRYCSPDDDLRMIVVPELPTAQLIAAKVHMEDLLRELQLALIHYTGSSDSESPCTPDAIRLTRRLVAAAEAAQLPANRYLTDPRSRDATIRARYLHSEIDQFRTT